MYIRTGILLIALTWALFGLAHIPVLRDFVQYGFDDGTYSHSYLIPFVCVFLIWEANSRSKFDFRPSVPMLIIATLSALLLSLAFLAQISTLFRVLFPIALTCYLLSIYRPSVSTIAAPAMLLFVVPIWGILAAPLQAISVMAVTLIMGLTPIPTFVEGNFITIPYGTFEIAGGCSGLRYLIVAIAISILYGYLNLNTKRSHLLLLAFAVVGAMIVNWLRIVGLILIGYFSEMQSPLVEDHNAFGWYLFIPFLLFLFLVGRKLQTIEGNPNLVEQAPQQNVESTPISWSFLALVATSMAISSTVVLTALAYRHAEQKPTVQMANVPEPAPFIANPSSIENLAEGVVYRFAGREHDNKASFYRNRFIPDGWMAVERWSNATHQHAIVRSKRGVWGVVRYGFGADGNSTSSRLHYRVQRLINATRLDASSALNWSFLMCDSLEDCQHRYQFE